MTTPTVEDYPSVEQIDEQLLMLSITPRRSEADTARMDTLLEMRSLVYNSS
jgi:hypothetical protein